MMAERLLLYRGELVLANSAKWAYPIVWDVLEGCSWGNAAIRVAYCWVIYPTTYVTYILLHNVSVFEVNTALISLLSIKSLTDMCQKSASCLIDVANLRFYPIGSKYF